MRGLKIIRYTCSTILVLVLLLFPFRVQAQGYSILDDKVVINSNEHWVRWKSASKTLQITDEGVRPVFIRTSTEIEIDGQIVRVPGINAVSNASEYGGGVLAAGSNASMAFDLMDGDLDTFWEPEIDDPIESWWVQIDLGRVVSANKVVFKFVEEDLGDPFLQFRVFTSQGEESLNNLIFRQVFVTDKLIKDQRVFEIELTLTEAATYGTIGEFTGDVIRYVGVIITASNYSKGRQVSQAEYENLEPDKRGDIEYFRQESPGVLSLLDGKEDWEAIEDESKRGPIVHYRRALPRLAEVEVWSVGDNIGLGVLDRGGTLSSTEAPDEPNVVDGNIKPAFHISTYYKNDPAPDNVQIWRELLIDLGGAFFVDNVRMITDLGGTHAQGTLLNYVMWLSDGSRTPDGNLAWKFVAEAGYESEIGQTKYHDQKFEVSKAKFFSLTWVLIGVWGGGGRGAIKEIQFFGEGYLPEAQIVSSFGGRSPFIELPGSKNVRSVEWDADTPVGTDVLIQTKTGDTLKQVKHYFRKVGDDLRGKELEGTEEEAKEAYDKLFSFAKGDIVDETVAGSDWSGWSEAYVRSGDRFRSPSPRKYVMIQATLLTDDPFGFATLRSMTLNFTVVVPDLVGDFDGDNKVGLSDFVFFLDVFGADTSSADWDPTFDLDSNEEIGLSDFVIFLDNFGRTGEFL